MMTNRSCGVVYYAVALPPLLSEKTEVYLIHKLEDGGYIVAVPCAPRLIRRIPSRRSYGTTRIPARKSRRPWSIGAWRTSVFVC